MLLPEEHIWNILGDHFKRKGFVHHQTESFNNFINTGISKIIQEEPDILITPNESDKERKFNSYRVTFSDIHVPSPTVIEESREIRGFCPSEARQRDLTYDSPIYATVTETLQVEGEKPEVTTHLRVILGRIPIMLRSSKCYLSNMTPQDRIKAGECEYDEGGYFIVKGKERVLISQIRGVYNKTLVLEQKPGEKYNLVADMRSMSEETGHSVLIQALLLSDEKSLLFNLPYIKDPIPIGVVFKAMGYKSEQFYDLVGLNCDKVDKYIRLAINDSAFVEDYDGFEYFCEKTKDKNSKKWDSMDDATKDIWRNKSTIENALKYIGSHTINPIKDIEKIDYAKQVVEGELFPHMGITFALRGKAYLLGHMIHKLLATKLGMRKPDDRDNYINKRIDSPGMLFHDLFRQLFKKYINSIMISIEKRKQIPDMMSIIPKQTDITKGFNTCCSTGNWGVPKNSYIRQGVAQVLSRLSYGGTLSHLRRISIPIGKESKNSAIRAINPSQIMFLCPAETPEGASIGIVLNLSLLTRISTRTSTVLVKEVVEMCENLILFDDFDGPNEETKVFLNGIILGMTSNPHELIEELRKFRNVKMLPWDVSFSYNDTDEEIHICSDDGRLYRPVFTVKEDRLIVSVEDGTNWDELVEKGAITYIDNMEANDAVIAFNENELVKYKNDYCEIAPAMMLGVMASIIPFPDHSQCIFQDEPVYMANGTVKKICQVQVGEEVITFHPDTQQQSITKVSHIYTNKTDKQLFEITTISGRKITATFDHRFMTFDGWKRIEEIQVGKTLVGVSTEPKPVSNLVDDYVILTKDQFIERCLDAKIKESFVKKYASELSFPIKSTDTNLYILSRLFGFISTDCWIGISDQGVVRVAGDFGHEHSAILFNADVEKLGFNRKIPSYSKKEGYGCTYRLEYSGSFPALFIALGCLYGKKSIQEYKPLPDWIKNGSDLVKREFLAGFQGGDGSKIKSGSTKQVNIHMSATSKSIKTEYVDSLMEFMNDIVELLRYFKIETNNAKCETSQKYEDRMTVSYYISSTRINLIKYFDLVGYRYDVYKNIESGIYVEYLKYLEKKYTERLKLIEEIKSYTDMIPSLIAKKMNIDVKIVYNIKKLQGVKIGLPKGLLSAEEWRNLVKWKSTTLFIPLESKIESLETIISDITTESTNQSFLCGDTFCVHNSPRNLYQSSMGKQAMSMFALSHLIRADTVVHVLNSPQKPLVSTKAAAMMGFDDMPSGINCIVAIACYTGLIRPLSRRKTLASSHHSEQRCQIAGTS